MTHAELIERAAKWLKNSKHCKIVLKEIVSGYETADAIGFTLQNSYLVECKTSINDFYADQKKHFRREPEYGMGVCRYYLCPDGLIDLNKQRFPVGWGLLYVKPKQIKVVRESVDFNSNVSRSLRAERHLLVSMLHRADIQFGLHNIKTYADYYKINESKEAKTI
jgi:hypothetical protein